MNLETLRSLCNHLPGVTEEVKWENDLCFLVGGKIFCITGFDPPLTASLKVPDEEFETLVAMEGVVPAPYLARYKWILIKEPDALTDREWKQFIRQSYELVKGKLPPKILKKHGLILLLIFRLTPVLGNGSD